MKVYKYKMSAYLKSRIFRPCRSKGQAMLNLVDTVRELLIASSNEQEADLVVVVSKFQRLFYLSDKKVYSIGFPFRSDRETQEGAEITFGDGVEVTNKLLSAVDTLIRAHLMEAETDFSDFFTTMMEELESDEQAWRLLKEIVMLEECYVRYDFDSEHADDGRGDKKVEGHNYDSELITHPLHHLDVFYSPEYTFKIGLKNGVDYATLLEIINPRARCRMLED